MNISQLKLRNEKFDDDDDDDDDNDDDDDDDNNNNNNNNNNLFLRCVPRFIVLCVCVCVYVQGVQLKSGPILI